MSENGGIGSVLPAPGARVLIRDAEWLVRKVDSCSDGGHVLDCRGVSELVRDKNGLFLTRLEEEITILDPKNTELVDDQSPQFRAARLFIDTMLRETAPTDERIHLAHRAAMDVIPFQLEPTLQALSQPRQRILIADAVGLGKTLEAGILVTELIKRGRGKRILVLAVKSMLTQFQLEFWNRFTIPLVRLDSAGLQRVRNHIPTNHNPFHYFDRSIVSIDTLKQDIEYRHHLEEAYWDIIVIDEAHNVAERGANSQRSRLAKLLSARSDTLIMLSATPHDGRAESFASLMNMLDPTAIADSSDYRREDYEEKGLVVRRFKKDIVDQLRGEFPEREISVDRIEATPVEEHAYERLMEVTFRTLDDNRNVAGQLFRTTLEKALFSSPSACLATIENRLKRLDDRTDSEGVADDVDTLNALRFALQAIDKDHFSKYQLLLRLLEGERSDFQWDTYNEMDRLVIFTESIPTLRYLAEHLPSDLNIAASRVAIMTGSMKDSELARTVDAFGKRDSDLRLLICSDVAAEGINLHHCSHKMIHFDIPWSLMTFQQRNGRIDRYGQKHQPQIRYLLTASEHEMIRGDARILEILIEKDEQASKNLGDPSEFMAGNDADEQADRVAQAMENNSDDVSDIFDALFGEPSDKQEPNLGTVEASHGVDPADAIVERTTLFGSDLRYAKTALDWLEEMVQSEVDMDNETVTVTAKNDLLQRLSRLPPEARPEHNRFVLTTNQQRMQEELDRCRQENSPWPTVHYLWPLHPVMEWLRDRVISGFGRHAAPILRVPTYLDPKEAVFLILGGFPNRRSHAVLQQWFAVRVLDGNVQDHTDIKGLLNRVPIDQDLPNPGRPGDTEILQHWQSSVVDYVVEQLREARQGLERRLNKKLTQQMAAMDALRDRHARQLEIRFDRSQQPDAFKQRARETREAEVDRMFDEYYRWLEDTQTTEEEPFIQVAGVLTGSPASS